MAKTDEGVKDPGTPPHLQLHSPMSSMASIIRSLYTHLRGIALVTPWALALLAQDIGLSLLLLLRPANPLLAYRLSSHIAWSCWAWIQLIFERLNGANIVISGDKIPEGESAVVICNHVGWSDFYMIQALAMKSGMLGYCRYFAKAQLKRVPLLGWGLSAMGMPLVTRNCRFVLNAISSACNSLVCPPGLRPVAWRDQQVSIQHV